MNDDNDTMLTTYDNPLNPFTDFEAWWKYDMLLGWDCCGTLAKEALTSESFSDEVNEKIIDDAMERICERYPMIYRIVARKDYEKAAS